MKQNFLKLIGLISILLFARTCSAAKFTFFNATHEKIAIKFNDQNFPIDPKKSVTIHFINPATVSFVYGPQLNQWSSRFEIPKSKQDKYYTIDWTETKTGLVLTATETSEPTKPNSK